MTKNWIIPLEIKYSTHNNDKSKPKWNSNIPKANTIYLFANPNNLTFFIGSDYLSPQIRDEYIDYFSDFDEDKRLQELEAKISLMKLQLNNELNNPFGLYPKIRIDYLERKNFESGKDFSVIIKQSLILVKIIIERKKYLTI